MPTHTSAVTIGCLFGKIEPIITSNYVTIGGEELYPQGIVTVFRSWTENEGKLRRKSLKNVLHFSYSLVNILNETALEKAMNYNEVIWVLIK